MPLKPRILDRMEYIADRLGVGISSRALFDLRESNEVFEHEGIDAYSRYQIDHESEVLAPGPAFHIVRKFLNLNANEPLVEVILLSRNSADTGLRIFNSIQHYGLNITRAAFTSGKSPYEYISAFGSHLFLSTHQSDVKDALCAGCAAAQILPTHTVDQQAERLRIAFDGDAVLFTNESEQIFQQQGIDAFNTNESTQALNPLPGGPFKGFLQALHKIQGKFPADNCPIRTALITAREAPAHERVIRTLRSWQIRVDEALFLGGLDKGDFLRAFKADIFFDDQLKNCQSAQQHVMAGHVPDEATQKTD